MKRNLGRMGGMEGRKEGEIVWVTCKGIGTLLNLQQICSRPTANTVTRYTIACSVNRP